LIKIQNSKVWKLQDDVDTDIIIPTQYLALKSVEDMKKYAFNPLRPQLASQIKPGDVIVVGRNFGCGSSREQASEILIALGIKCVIAKSFSRIFYRNSLSNGLMLIDNNDIQGICNEGDKITIDFQSNAILCNNERVLFSAVPKELLDMVEVGGLLPYMKQLNRI